MNSGSRRNGPITCNCFLLPGKDKIHNVQNKKKKCRFESVRKRRLKSENNGSAATSRPDHPGPGLCTRPHWVLFTSAHSHCFHGSRNWKTTARSQFVSFCIWGTVPVCVHNPNWNPTHNQSLCSDAHEQSYITGIIGYHTLLDKQTLDVPMGQNPSFSGQSFRGWIKLQSQLHYLCCASIKWGRTVTNKE